MRKPSGLTGSSVNGDSNIDDVADTSEKIVEITVGHLEGHVANEQSLAWWVLGTVISWWSALASLGLSVGVGKGDHQTTTFKRLLIECINSRLCDFGSLKFNVTKSNPS